MNELTPLLQELATKLNTTMDHLWQVLIYQSHIFIIEYFIWVLIFIVTLTASIKYIKWITNNKEIDNETPHFFGVATAIFINFTIFMGLIFNLNNLLSALLNPEYYALKQILSYLK